MIARRHRHTGRSVRPYRQEPTAAVRAAACAGPGLLARLFRHDRPRCDRLSRHGRGIRSTGRGAATIARRSCGLPHGRFCYAPPDYAPDAGRSAARCTRGYVTFGSFNNVTKIGPEVVRLWAEVLRAAPGSRLLLKWKSLDDSRRVAAARRCVRRRRRRAGAAGAARLFASSRDAGAIWRHRRRARSVSLRRRPDELRGLVDGRAGRDLAGRSAGIAPDAWDFSVASASSDCVASSPADYVGARVALAADPGRLTELRRALRPRMAASPLCDGALFTPTLEAAFRQMWLRWIAGNGGVATGSALMVDAA